METEVSLDENKTEFTVFNDSGDTIFEWSDDDSENLQDELVLKAEEVVSKHLEIDSVFNNKYKIKKILGQGGLGITYLAVEDISNKKVVIKEFFPKGYVSRAKDGSVILGNKISKENYNTLLKTFEQEAQNLVKVTVDKHPNIVNFLSFEENINNTKYFLMDFEEGEDLSEYIKKEDVTLTEKEISSIINPILDGLSHIHKLDVYHKDIKPDNIFLRKNADPMLIDFGASVSSVLYLTPAYAPIEQVKQDIDIKQGNLSPQKAQFGAYTDIYSLGVVLYNLVMRSMPPSAKKRSEALIEGETDPYISLIKSAPKGYSKHFLKAIDQSLKMAKEERPKSAQEFKNLLKGSKNKLYTTLAVVFLTIITFLIIFLTKGEGTLLLDTDYKDYKVLIDGDVKVTKSNQLTLYEGKHDISIQKQGFISIGKKTIEITANKSTNYEVKFVPSQKEITINTSPSGATIVVDDVEISGENFIAKYGKKYKITVSKKYYDTLEIVKDYISLQDSPELKLKLTPQKGDIIFITDSKSWGATAMIYDGDKQILSSTLREGETKVSLNASDNIRLEIIKDGYSPVRVKQISLKPSKHFKFNVNLEKMLVSFKKVPKLPEMIDTKDGYLISKYEVTYEEFARFLNSSSFARQNLTSTGHKLYAQSIFGFLREKNGLYAPKQSYRNYPVTNISWYGAVEYVKWLRKVSNRNFKLPTVNQWKLATQKGFNENTLYISVNYDSRSLLEVGSKKANKIGIYDLLGNVAEWCRNGVNNYKQEIRGGSYKSKKSFMTPNKVASEYKANVSRNDLGFRIVEIK